MKQSLRCYVCTWVIAVSVFLLGGPRVHAVNLILNGDFSLGNVGFTSQYTYDDTAPMGGSGYYTIGTNPQTWNSQWAAFGDHTTGFGNMLIADGWWGGLIFPKTVWEQTVNVVQNTPYRFSYWSASSYGSKIATLRTYINNVSIGDLVLPSQTGQWVQFTAMWNSGSATSATIQLVVTTGYAHGLNNDFVLDDLSMQAIPEPGTMWLFSAGVAAMALRRRKKG